MKKIIFILIILHLTFTIEHCLCQWVQMSSGMGNVNTVNTFAANGNIIFAGTHYGVWLSTNNGHSWVRMGLTDKYVCSLAISGNNLFGGCLSQGVWLSTNNGQSWSQTAMNNKTVKSLAISGNIIFAGTSNYGVWLSTNSGQNWTQTSLNNQSVSSLAISGNIIFAGTGNTGVWISNNNGQNWTQTVLNNVNVNSIAISGNSIFAGTEQLGVWRSTNNGQYWMQTALNNITVYSLATYENNIFAGCYGIYLLINSGQSWILKNQGFNGYPYVHAFLVANDYIFAGTYGQSVWRRSLLEIIGIKKISTEVPEEYELGQNYPNPFNSMTNVKFKMLNAGNAVIKVFDISGREVRTLVDEELQAGVYEVRFESGDLPSGIYFYRMETKKFSDTKKLILLK